LHPSNYGQHVFLRQNLHARNPLWLVYYFCCHNIAMNKSIELHIYRFVSCQDYLHKSVCPD
jgi:hypothetical protein